MLHLLATIAALATAAEKPWVDASVGVRPGAPTTLAKSGRGPSVAAVGAQYVAAWLEGDPDGGPRRGCVVVLTLNAAGRPVGAPRRLECAQDIGPPKVASSGDRVAVIWPAMTFIEVRILSPDLAVRAETHWELSRLPDRIAVSHDGSTFVLAWSNYDEAGTLPFTADGAFPREQPSIVDRRTNETDVEGGDVACVSSGDCAVLFRHFYGNSRTSVGSARLVHGAPGGSFSGYPGPFEARAIGGAGRLFLFFSTYARIVGENALNGSARVFDFETNEYDIRDIAGAIGPQGTLIAWYNEPRLGIKRGTSIAYIHPDPNGARPHPMELPDEISPAVATLDGSRFVLLTGSYGMGAIRARVVDVDPSKFGKSPEQRGPALEGVARGPNGQPAASANVSCFLWHRGGGLSAAASVVRPDGHFSIRHPYQEDLRAVADVTRLLCWAQQEGSVSGVLEGAPTGGPATLQLRPAAAPARVRLIALSATGEGRYGEDLQVLVAPGARNRVGMDTLGKGRALELEDVAPGPTVVTLFSPQGFQVTHRIQLQPGADHTIELPFALELPAGKAGLVLDEKLAVLAVPPGAPAERAGARKGDVVVAVDGRHPQDRQQAIEWLGGAPGTPVAVTVRRGGATQSLQIIRSAGGALPPPRIRINAPAAKAAPLIQPGPGERVLAEAAVLPRDPEGPFRVDLNEAVPLPDTLRVLVDLPAEINEAHAALLTATITGPGDLRETRTFRYFNRRTVHQGCDPVVGGGPDQCSHTTWDESAAAPPLEFGPELLNTKGIHHLTVSASGLGEVRRTFLVVPYELGPAYERHQQRQLGSYRLEARATVQRSAPAGARPLVVHRALFRSGARSLLVDVSESGRPNEEIEAALNADRWAQATWVPTRDHRAFKLLKRPDGFEAAWNANLLVRVAGAELGPEEQAVVDAYLSNFPSRRPASP